MNGTWYDDNDHGLYLKGLKNGHTDAFVNDATVVATLYDADGAELSGVSWPLTLNYVAGSNGNYFGVVDQALAVTPRDKITAKVTAVSGTLDAQWEEQITVLKRRTL